ncbi:type I-E CRISPR-associated protein Cas6/Cse3/CasE [Planomonospora sp. ID67723]|uniref:type I-E CRISPR-associated protein Cas6/Cse3/CasE n=1 Tax=Planomonospora sp. ID67723 TaxID=2738134 RepID=UPI0018C39502|nr:type I-E CRISPR-associated protein Cas6/Cse3/CasE [Planomonospora sp. ID67723]MBG0828220.1 type I-E CRISPR-associated protein Cas6/Cse3/CasE [Planomonospora sp. ID67723]
MTAWLVRILPDLRRRDVNNDLADPDRLHKRMMMLMPDEMGERARAQTGVLFRVEDTRSGLQILVQSSMKPDLSRLPDGYGEIALRELNGLLSRLQPGVLVHYRIIANPSKRLGKNAGPKAGKIEALRGAAAEEWWVTRAAANGLAVAAVSSQSQQDIRAKGTVRHAAVRFDGSATVTDSDTLRAAVLQGVGRGKTYGCGLLSLALAQR